ncbi:GntR family transcriptional regulator [Listeria monocytogenes]|nr:GntR family transcriptional regulator [Listeria monocytogenes]
MKVPFPFTVTITSCRSNSWYALLTVFGFTPILLANSRIDNIFSPS